MSVKKRSIKTIYNSPSNNDYENYETINLAQSCNYLPPLTSLSSYKKEGRNDKIANSSGQFKLKKFNIIQNKPSIDLLSQSD